MIRRALARFPFLPNAITVVAFAIGAVWRYRHIFSIHDPRNYLYSEMLTYVETARRVAEPGHVLQKGDVALSPGLVELLAWAHGRDPSLASALWPQLLVSALLPLSVGLLARMTFPGATRAAIVVASLYYPFVDIGGYFLPEPYVALFGTFSLACWFWVVRLIEAAPAGRRITGKIAAVAAAGGVSLAVAAAMSFLAVSAVLATVLLHLALTKGPPRRSRAVAAGVLFLAAVPVLGWQTERCTSANGTLCPSTNTIPADVLVGHYGRIQAIIWRDPTTGLSASRGSPSFWQHGYRERPEVQHRITNQRKNLQLAWKWTRKHPWQALTVSSEHVWDTLAGVHAWPTVGTAYWPPLYAFQYLFIVLLFFPTSALLVDLARRRGIKGMLQSVELATLGPIFGLSLWVFFTWGEPRFRFPWDGSFIILTIEFFRRLKVPLSLADPPAAEAAARAATEPQPEPQPAEEAA